MNRPNSGRPWRRIRDRVIRRDHGICHLCGQPGADTADHLIPVAHGGPPLSMTNLAAAHDIPCNRIRGTRPVDDVRHELMARAATNSTGWRW